MQENVTVQGTLHQNYKRKKTCHLSEKMSEVTLAEMDGMQKKVGPNAQNEYFFVMNRDQVQGFLCIYWLRA